MYKYIIGDNIKKYRLRKELTQEDLAEALGISHSFISQIEIGKKAPSLRVLYMIADYLEISPALLLLNQDESNYSEIILLLGSFPKKKYAKFLLAFSKAMLDLIEDN